MEIESALVSHPRVAEAAVVGRPHEIKGESVFAYVVCRGARPTGNVAGLVDELRKWVSEQLGAIARPDDIRFADNLPKTRSGKIMRRLLRSIARDEEISQDVSTLENPGILDQLRGVDAGAAAKAAARRKSRTPTKSAAKKAAVAKGKPARGKAARGKVASARSARKPARTKVARGKPTRGKPTRGRPTKRAAARKKRR
jgi:hypothetical protein